MREFPDTKRGRAAAHTRSKVIAAAADLFAARGYEDVGIRDVAKAVGMSTGAVFSHFADKDALFLAATGRAPPGPRLREFLAYLAEHDPSSIVDELRADLYGDGQ